MIESFNVLACPPPSTPGRYYFHGRFLGRRVGKNCDVRRVEAHDSEDLLFERDHKNFIKKARKISPGAESGLSTDGLVRCSIKQQPSY